MIDQIAALRVCIRVARTGSFSRVANELDLAQPTELRRQAASGNGVGHLASSAKIAAGDRGLAMQPSIPAAAYCAR